MEDPGVQVRQVRKRRSAAEKRLIVEQASEPGASVARVARAQPRRMQRRLLDRQAAAVFSDHALQRFAVQTQLRRQQLQAPVLIFRRLQPLRFAHVHAAVLRLPAIERRRADPMLPAQVRRLYPASCCFNIPMICSSLNLLFFSFSSGPPVQITRELQL